MQIPVIGTRVQVTIDDSKRVMFVPWPKTYIITGVIVESNPWDNEQTFKVMRDKETVIPGARGDSVISKQVVIKLDILEETKQVPILLSKTHEVIGSKGDVYTVTEIDSGFTCNCQAGKRGIKCRHIKEVESNA